MCFLIFPLILAFETEAHLEEECVEITFLFALSK